MIKSFGGGLFFWISLIYLSPFLPQLSGKMPDYSRFKYFGFRGVQPGEFRYPAGIYIDSNQKIYVTDWKNNRVQFFNSEGVFGGLFGTASEPFHFDGPVGLTPENGDQFWIVEMNASRLTLFDFKAGTLIRRMGRSGKNHGQFHHPRGLARDSKGILFVADTGNKRIEVLNNEGSYRESFNFKDSKGDSIAPRDVLLTHDDTLVATFSEDKKVLCFNRAGEILWEFGNSNSNLKGVPKLEEPRYVAQDFRGDFYITDFSRDQVIKLDQKGKFLSTIGKSGSQPGAFKNPEGIAVSPSGDLYIADSGNDRCQILKVSEALKSRNDAWKFFQKNQFGKAIENYEKFLLYEPGHPEVIRNLIRCLNKQGDIFLTLKEFQKAETCFRSILGYGPENQEIPEKIDQIFWMVHGKTFEKMAYSLTFIALFLIFISFVQMKFFRKKKRG